VTFSVTIENLKAHVLAFIQAEGIELEGGAHKCIAKFAAFVEGKQAEQDAIDLLTARGYTINQPLVILPTPPALP
jgi:hypothetical protein